RGVENRVILKSTNGKFPFEVYALIEIPEDGDLENAKPLDYMLPVLGQTVQWSLKMVLFHPAEELSVEIGKRIKRNEGPFSDINENGSDESITFLRQHMDNRFFFPKIQQGYTPVPHEHLGRRRTGQLPRDHYVVNVQGSWPQPIVRAGGFSLGTDHEFFPEGGASFEIESTDPDSVLHGKRVTVTERLIKAFESAMAILIDRKRNYPEALFDALVSKVSHTGGLWTLQRPFLIENPQQENVAPSYVHVATFDDQAQQDSPWGQFNQLPGASVILQATFDRLQLLEEELGFELDQDFLIDLKIANQDLKLIRFLDPAGRFRFFFYSPPNSKIKLLGKSYSRDPRTQKLYSDNFGPLHSMDLNSVLDPSEDLDPIPVDDIHLRVVRTEYGY
ncbi:MAG: hypothetical protein AAF202_12740, partial [Pseudomonadota bacterium]